MKQRRPNGILLEVLLSLAPVPPSATAAELAEDLLPNAPLEKARQSISCQLWQLRARGWIIVKDAHGRLLLDRGQYRLLLEWSRRRTEQLGCYGVRPFTPENLRRFCELLLPEKEKKATTKNTEDTEKGHE